MMITNQEIAQKIDALTASVARGISIVAESPETIMKAYCALIARNAELRPTPETGREKTKLSQEAGTIFAKDIEGNRALESLTIDGLIKAADVTDVSVGTLAGTLVLQRALPLLQYEFPILSSVYTDFTGDPGLLGQREVTRMIMRPAIQTYDPTLDSGGRPKGWTIASPGQSVDVPITLDEYVGVPIVFGSDMLSRTVRRLFDEQAPMALYALGSYFVNKVMALITAASFNAYKGNSATAGATTSGSETITVASTANMFVGQEISGTGIPANTCVAAVVNGTTATLTQKSTATNSGLTFTLNGGKVPTNYSTYAEPLADFNFASLGKIGAIFSTNEVPFSDRSVLLNSDYFARLSADPVFSTFYAAFRSPEIVTDNRLPRIQRFNPIEAPWFPSSNNRVGFAFHKSALILKARPPQDVATLGIMVPGNVTLVTAPSGLSVSLVQYMNLQANYAESRPEVMIGAAVGQPKSGMVLTSQ
jgi:hypothetical protein